MTNREDLISYISDAHKDLYGSRPRGFYDFASMTENELEILASELSNSISAEIEEDRRREARAIVKFEELIEKMMELGAADRMTAIRWIAEGTDDEKDVDYICWTLGLPYTMAATFKEALV